MGCQNDKLFLKDTVLMGLTLLRKIRNFSIQFTKLWFSFGFYMYILLWIIQARCVFSGTGCMTRRKMSAMHFCRAMQDCMPWLQTCQHTQWCNGEPGWWREGRCYFIFWTDCNGCICENFRVSHTPIKNLLFLFIVVPGFGKQLQYHDGGF